MKRLLHTIILSIFLLTFPLSPFAQDKPPSWSVYFSPHGGCTDAITKELNSAKSTILVQAYSFTSAPIAKGLLNAHKRGVKVQVLLDKSQASQRLGQNWQACNEHNNDQYKNDLLLQSRPLLLLCGKRLQILETKDSNQCSQKTESSSSLPQPNITVLQFSNCSDDGSRRDHHQEKGQKRKGC